MDKQKRRQFHAKTTSAKLYIYVGVGATNLYIDKAHTALDIFCFAAFFSWNLFRNSKFLIFSASSHPDFLGNEQFHILTLHSVSHMDTNPHDRSPDDTQPVKLLINYLFLSWGVTIGRILAENKFQILDDLFQIHFGRASILAKFRIICINFGWFRQNLFQAEHFRPKSSS